MLRLRDIMTTDVLTVSPELSIRDAMSLFATQHVSGAPVLASGKVVGVVSTTDLMEFAADLPGVPTARAPNTDEDLEEWEEQEEEIEIEDEDETSMAFFADSWEDAGADVSERMHEVNSPEWNALEEHTIAEAMTRDVFSLTPGTAVDVAADRMRTAGVHRVLVMDGEQLLGIVSTKDIANAVADHKLTTQRFIFNAE